MVDKKRKRRSKAMQALEEQMQELGIRIGGCSQFLSSMKELAEDPRVDAEKFKEHMKDALSVALSTLEGEPLLTWFRRDFVEKLKVEEK